MNLDDARKWAHAYLQETSATAARIAEGSLDSVAGAAALIVERIRGGGKILICGNGGSAADSQALAAEFVSTLATDYRRPAIPAVALTTDSSILTAIGNDFGFEGVFERQVEALGRAGDVLIGISTSGNSTDVLRAFDRARAQGLATIALTGEPGGELAGRADVCVRVPSAETSHIQEGHLAIEHTLAFLVERSLYPRT